MTASMRRAEWTWLSLLRQRPTRRPRRSSRPLTCLSPIDRPWRYRGGKEELDRKERHAHEAGQEHRRAAGTVEGDRRGPNGSTRRAVFRPAQIGGAAAQRLRNSCPKPLLADRPAAWILPKVQVVAHRAARTRLVGANSGH